VEPADKAGILNLGLRDQVTALKWVKKNIGAFGGDKNKVLGPVVLACHLSQTRFALGYRIRRECRINHDFDFILELSFGNTRERDGTSTPVFPSFKFIIIKQILESGSPATAVLFNASHGELAWQTFASGVPSCAQTASSGHTLDCLRQANSSDIAQGLRTSLGLPSPSGLFIPTLDGPNGFIPDYPSKCLARGRLARVPFIAGTNLDEGGEIVLFSPEAETLSMPQERLSPRGASIQTKTFTTSSSRATLHRRFRLRSLTMWQRKSWISIPIFLPWGPHSARVTRLLV